ncbi:hypothetical protein BDF14DRAFT_1805776 [Spinellus fusiger]|nr:hypothetical protein BDF14DRAFT_1805776 [Spinellus fusiger]
MPEKDTTPSSLQIARRRLERISSQVSVTKPKGATFCNESLQFQRKQGSPPHSSQLTPTLFLLKSCLLYKNKTAIIYRHRSYTYQTLATRVHQLANALIDNYGIQVKDRVGILCQNIPAAMDANYGVPCSGGVLVPINTRLASDEIEYIIDHSGVSILIIQDEFWEKLTDKIKATVKLIRVSDADDVSTDPYEQLLMNSSCSRSWQQLPLLEDENDLFSINYTSGSTGRPKGVMVTHRGVYLSSVSVVINAGITSESIYLWTLPMFHCNGWSFPWALVLAGSTQIMLSKMDYDNIWYLMVEKGVTHYAGAPTVQNEICSHPNAQRLKNPVKAYSGGSALSGTQIRRMFALNIQPIHIYGLTETYGPTVIGYTPILLQDVPENEREAYYARQGFSTVITDNLRVLNRNTAKDVVPDGKEIGEICFTGNLTMIGYYNDPVETEKAFRHGVFWSGDLAIRHPDGAIEVMDRSKDIIISGGENISSIEVEGVILRMNQVMECAVVGRPDEKWGEVPHAFVILRKGKILEEKDIVEHCQQFLARFKCPKTVTFIDTLPKTATGKTQKFLLKKEFWKNIKKGIN